MITPEVIQTFTNDCIKTVIKMYKQIGLVHAIGAGLVETKDHLQNPKVSKMREGNSKKYEDYAICFFHHENIQHKISTFVNEMKPIGLCMVSSGYVNIQKKSIDAPDFDLKEELEISNKTKFLLQFMKPEDLGLINSVVLTFEINNKSKIMVYECKEDLVLIEDTDWGDIKDQSQGGILSSHIKNNDIQSTKYGSFKEYKN